MNTPLATVIEKVLSDESDVSKATSAFQAEFPYEREGETMVTRREFCGFLFLTSSAFFLSTLGFAAKSAYDSARPYNFSPQPISGAAEMERGTALNFAYPDEEESAILIRSRDGSYHAFGQKSTHLSCPVYYSREHDRLECPCHEGAFNSATGEVLYGPPPRPLDRIPIEVRNGNVYAVGREVRGSES